MEISAKDWFTLLATVQSLKTTSDVQGTQLSMLTETLERSGALSREHLAEMGSAMSDLTRHLQQQEVAMQNPENPGETARRVDIHESGVITRPPAVVGEHLEQDFGELMDKALFELRRAEGN